MPEWSKGCDLRSHGESLVGSNPTPCKYARLAQSVERTAFNRVVKGSIPLPGIFFFQMPL